MPSQISSTIRVISNGTYLRQLLSERKQEQPACRLLWTESTFAQSRSQLLCRKSVVIPPRRGDRENCDIFIYSSWDRFWHIFSPHPRNTHLGEEFEHKLLPLSSQLSTRSQVARRKVTQQHWQKILSQMRNGAGNVMHVQSLICNSKLMTTLNCMAFSPFISLSCPQKVVNNICQSVNFTS